MCLSTTDHAHSTDHAHAPIGRDESAGTTANTEATPQANSRPPSHDGAVDRRGFLRRGAAVAGAGLLASLAPVAPARARGRGARRRKPRTVDLTHRLVKDFPDFFGAQPVITDQVDNDFDTTGFYSKSWTFPEHIGTHVDSPGHFSQGGRLVDDLTTDELVAPLVVIDIRRKAMDDPNAMVEPADLVDYERGHGRIPEGALVAMDSGWHDKVDDPDDFLGGSGFPDLNFPGFSVDATDWLIAHRDPVGIGVDTPSLDPGNSTTFAVHFSFLGSDRYGIENLDNLTAAPAKNATVFVGAVPWEDGSGGPCRVIATR